MAGAVFTVDEVIQALFKAYPDRMPKVVRIFGFTPGVDETSSFVYVRDNR